jgi:hypothetical protein
VELQTRRDLFVIAGFLVNAPNFVCRFYERYYQEQMLGEKHSKIRDAPHVYVVIMKDAGSTAGSDPGYLTRALLGETFRWDRM